MNFIGSGGEFDMNAWRLAGEVGDSMGPSGGRSGKDQTGARSGGSGKVPRGGIAVPKTKREGDWQCTNCPNINFAKRNRCNKCGTPKPAVTTPIATAAIPGVGPGTPPAGGGGGFENTRHDQPKMPSLARGDWLCKSCMNMNWARREKCNICNLPKQQDDTPRTGRGGGHFERQDPADRQHYDSDDEDFDEFGRRKRKSKGQKGDSPLLRNGNNQASEGLSGPDAPGHSPGLMSEEEEAEDDEDDDRVPAWMDDSDLEDENAESKTGGSPQKLARHEEDGSSVSEPTAPAAATQDELLESKQDEPPAMSSGGAEEMEDNQERNSYDIFKMGIRFPPAPPDAHVIYESSESDEEVSSIADDDEESRDTSSRGGGEGRIRERSSSTASRREKRRRRPASGSRQREADGGRSVSAARGGDGSADEKDARTIDRESRRRKDSDKESRGRRKDDHRRGDRRSDRHRREDSQSDREQRRSRYHEPSSRRSDRTKSRRRRVGSDNSR